MAGLTAYKKFYLATSRAAKTTDETHPNPYDVYVHDTPADHLFARIGRTLSHGCVRVASAYV